MPVLALPLLLAIPARAAPAGPTAGGGGEPGRLARHVGTYGYDAVLYDPVVSRALYALLGGRDKRLLIEALQVVRPIATSDGCLVLQGHAAAGTGAAILAVGCRQGAIDAALLYGGAVSLFTSRHRLAMAASPVLATAARWAVWSHVPLSVRLGTGKGAG